MIRTGSFSFRTFITATALTSVIHIGLSVRDAFAAEPAPRAPVVMPVLTVQPSWIPMNAVFNAPDLRPVFVLRDYAPRGFYLVHFCPVGRGVVVSGDRGRDGALLPDRLVCGL